MGRLVASAFVGMAGTPIYAESAERGRRWSFQNVLGAIVKTWDEHGRRFRVDYDMLHRPLSAFVQDEGGTEILFHYIVYGDRRDDAESLNLLGGAHQIFDQAGALRVPEMDFKGNPKSIERVLAKDHKGAANWTALPAQPDVDAIQAAANPSLEATEIFSASARYDALNRPTDATLPDGTEILPTYDEANSLASLRARIGGLGPPIEFLKAQGYDAKGQRQTAHYGNEVFTHYFYDPETFRLTSLLTHKAGADPETQALQHLRYVYDPVGNVTQIADDAQQTHYFNNAVVKPENRFEYDALYQLIRATGRELAGTGNDSLRTHADFDAVPQLPHQNDVAAMRTYTEEYDHDLLGNIKSLNHRFRPQPGIGDGWTRHYRYAFEAVPSNLTNRLIATGLPGDADAGPFSGTYDHDVYGNMTRMPHLAAMDWTFLDQLGRVELGGGGTAHYVYGVAGQRVRKVIERDANFSLEWIFLGPLTIFRRRRRSDGAVRLERSTVHISDNVGRIAQIDTKIRDDDNADPGNALGIPLIRYQYGNHLGSAVLETDAGGNPISYEEYHPFGTTAFRSARPGFDLSLKCYRFSGKESDDETGFYYFGARYYAPWLGRWTSSDPAGFKDGPQLYRYCRNNPVNMTDPIGLESIYLGERPKEISIAQVTHTEASGKKYEAWVKSQLLERDGKTYSISGGTRMWIGGHWTIKDPVYTLVEKPAEDAADEVTVTPPSTGPASNQGKAGPAPAETSSAQTASPESTGSETGTEMAPVPGAIRGVAQEVARPASVTGEAPRGNLHLWSGPGGKAEALAAIQSEGSGWMMGNIGGQPTPEHAAGEAEFARARAGAPGGRLPQAEVDRIWGPRSASVVGRGAFAGHPVQAHGTPAPTAIQPRYEWPARSVGGGFAGGLYFGTGMFTAIMGGQDPNPFVAIPLVLAGVGEATSGIIYGSGALLGDAGAMAIGSAGATALGGIGAAIGFGVASARAFKEGDVAGGVMNGLGAIGGILLFLSLFTPVGWVGLLGIGLIGLAAGFNLGRWFSK